MIAPAADVCDRLTVNLRMAAVRHVVAAAGLDPHALDVATADDLGTRDFIRLALELGVAPSELASRAEQFTGEDHDVFPLALATVLRGAALDHVALAADVEPAVLHGNGRELTCADVDAIAGALGLGAKELVRAASLPPLPDDPAWCTAAHDAWEPIGGGELEVVHRAVAGGLEAVQSVFRHHDGSTTVAGVTVDVGGDVEAASPAEAAADLRQLAADALALACVLDQEVTR